MNKTNTFPWTRKYKRDPNTYTEAFTFSVFHNCAALQQKC